MPVITFERISGNRGIRISFRAYDRHYTTDSIETATLLARLYRLVSDPITITVYTREECHLCVNAIETIRSVIDSLPQDVDVTLVDIDTDSELRAEYGDRVPYVFVNGQPRFKYRVDEDELRDVLSSDSV